MYYIIYDRKKQKKLRYKNGKIIKFSNIRSCFEYLLYTLNIQEDEQFLNYDINLIC